MSYTAIFDIESDGLLDTMTRVHCLVIHIPEFNDTYFYRQNDEENTIEEGLKVLEDAGMLIGHNIVGFDLPALEMVYPNFQPKGRIRDTLVLARMVFSDEKDRDFRRFEKGALPGKYIGLHKLEAWGYRLGEMKGDYNDQMRELAKAQGITDEKEIVKFVWGSWNIEMEEYCGQDVVVTTKLWDKIKRANWDENSVLLEHTIHHLMFEQEVAGFHFDKVGAEQLLAEVTQIHSELTGKAEEHFGNWFAPEKKYVGDPRPQFGEDESRRSWGEVTVPKRTITYKDPSRWSYIEGKPFCRLKLKEFNPNSRPMIIDRLKTIYDWEPVDFTEKGNAEVNDKVLTKLSEQVPICKDLAEIFFYSKLRGAISEGKNGWLKMVADDGAIHGYVNVGGTVSGRASHSSPNVAQVPKVKSVPVLDKNTGELNRAAKGQDGNALPECFDADGNLRKNVTLLKRAGRYGFECRSLFIAPPGWWLMGCDLSGIELRCLGHHLAAFDGGEYLKIILDGDPHTVNMTAFQVNSRDTAKTGLYAVMYGAGDEKLGSIVCPPLTPKEQMIARGRVMRSNFEAGIPAFGQLMKLCKREARQGYVVGLDGRRLFVRSPHATLNLKLQSDGALIAKKWVVIFHELMEAEGYVKGTYEEATREGRNREVDYFQCAWVHDEIQVACRTKEIALRAGELAELAAKMAGEAFEYRSPVEAQSKIGRNWAETH